MHYPVPNSDNEYPVLRRDSIKYRQSWSVFAFLSFRQYSFDVTGTQKVANGYRIAKRVMIQITSDDTIRYNRKSLTA